MNEIVKNIIEPRERLELNYKNESDQYRLNKDDRNQFMKRQYIHIYRIRSGQLKGRLIKNARRILGNDKLTITDLDCRENNEEMFIVGTVFKRMKYRQSVLYEFADDTNFQEKYTKKPGENITDDDDLIELEENQQLLKIVGNIHKHHYVTGDTIGIFGTQDQDSDLFTVKEVIFPELPDQIPWPLIEKDCYLAFISGISLTRNVKESYKTYMALNAFQKWINGEVIVPSDEEEYGIVQNIARLIIAGDWVKVNTLEIQWQKVASTGVDQETDFDCLTEFDHFLTRFAQNLTLDLMPGANDPVQCSIPQQPIPGILFETGDKFRPMLNPVTNPYSFSVAGLQFLGTSGQNINDLGRLTRDMPPMELMERTLKMGHLFPTVPDTMAGFPFGNRDPMILDHLPHVYFCGNQPSFGVKMVDLDNNGEKNGANNEKRSLLLSIPKFHETFEVVILNLRTLHAFTYSFDMEAIGIGREEAIEQ